MRKIILSVAVSLDGYIEGPNGEYDWCMPDQNSLSEFFKRIDTLFMGRKTYELAQSMADQPMPGFPKFKEYVFSRTLTSVKSGAELIKDDIEEEVKRIKNEKGKDIWLFGGASLTTSLMNLGLVDELSLALHPILLGKGKPLFNDIQQRKHLRLLNSKTYKTGLVSLNYQIEGS